MRWTEDERGVNTMQNKNNFENIEIEYNKSLSLVRAEDDNKISFYNKIVPNMYDYNFTYLKRSYELDELIKIVANEKEESIKNNKRYEKICFKIGECISESISSFCTNENIDHDEITFMSISKDKIKNYKSYYGVTIVLVNDDDTLNEFIKVNYLDDEKISKQYAESRKQLIYTQYNNSNFKLYLAYYSGKAVGTSELFTYNNYGKVENIFVDEAFRNKGICTEMLKDIIKNNEENIYLTTYTEDDAISLYKKLDFKIEATQIELFKEI